MAPATMLRLLHASSILEDPSPLVLPHVLFDRGGAIVSALPPNKSSPSTRDGVATLRRMPPASNTAGSSISSGRARKDHHLSAPVPSLRSSLESSIRKLFGCTSRLQNYWFTLPKVGRYCVSGNLGNLCFYLLEQSIAGVLHEQPELLPESFLVSKHTVSFVLAYLLQVIPQHLLHAFLVYGLATINTPTKYLTTLAGTYSAFAFSMIGSTILNGMLIRFLNKNAAFVATIITFSVVNYFFISWIVRRTSKSPITAAPRTLQSPEPTTRIRGGWSETINHEIVRSRSADDCHLIESSLVDLSSLDVHVHEQRVSALKGRAALLQRDY